MKRCVMNSPFPLGQVGSRKEDVPEKDPRIETEKNPLQHLDKFSWHGVHGVPGLASNLFTVQSLAMKALYTHMKQTVPPLTLCNFQSIICT